MFGIPKLYLYGGFALLVAVAIFFIVRDIKHDAFQSGREAQAETVRAIVAANDAHNRKLEASLQANLDALALRLGKHLDGIETRSVERRETVREIISHYPELKDCRVPQEVLEVKNAGRARP